MMAPDAEAPPEGAAAAAAGGGSREPLQASYDTTYGTVAQPPLMPVVINIREWSGQWSDGLFSCLRHPMSCLLGTFCCFWFLKAVTLEKTRHLKLILGVAFFGLLFFLPFCFDVIMVGLILDLGPFVRVVQTSQPNPYVPPVVKSTVPATTNGTLPATPPPSPHPRQSLKVPIIESNPDTQGQEPGPLKPETPSKMGAISPSFIGVAWGTSGGPDVSREETYVEVNWRWGVGWLWVVLVICMNALGVISLLAYWWYRKEIRALFHIASTDSCDDICVVAMCLPCSVCQEYRHVLRACGDLKDMSPINPDLLPARPVVVPPDYSPARQGRPSASRRQQQEGGGGDARAAMH
ncbi:unnamed protein product [Vitrella brassicaformis CCMP3155]|uniref:Uncharacterized protein n=2 Tax=Vitrella brassicaformis TaxID=1169539 RepID=A0A0G4EUX0_VITBC|nr:unnamed protein product [Vitrella brassicaformis CCMP3155]|eukprot:CEM02049.1 unnamed protein product [Vitrella brassicaformis CCMP3155]